MRLDNRVMSAHLPPAPQSFKLRISSYQRSLFVAKNKQAMRELPDFTEAVALLLETGLPVGVALSWLQPRMTGELGKELEIVISNTGLGADLSAELSEAATRIGDEGFHELVEKLNMSLDRG
ncbi:MAG: type II secretion system F family protein, partial [Candidatus Aquiluna sp.]|nr:type II secretion system F family protein [Aquiluna sp.]